MRKVTATQYKCQKILAAVQLQADTKEEGFSQGHHNNFIIPNKKRKKERKWCPNIVLSGKCPPLLCECEAISCPCAIHWWCCCFFLGNTLQAINSICNNCQINSSMQEIRSYKKLANKVFVYHSLYFPSKITSMTFPTSSTCSLSKNKSDELISSSHPGYFHTDFMLLPGHQGLVNMQGKWMAVWRALQHVTGNRWEKHERSSVSQWNESLKRITIPFYPILSKKYMQPICQVSPSATWCMTFLIMPGRY